eukprot:4397796-Prymnesium_polylepis.1
MRRGSRGWTQGVLTATARAPGTMHRGLRGWTQGVLTATARARAWYNASRVQRLVLNSHRVHCHTRRAAAAARAHPTRAVITQTPQALSRARARELLGAAAGATPRRTGGQAPLAPPLAAPPPSLPAVTDRRGQGGDWRCDRGGRARWRRRTRIRAGSARSTPPTPPRTPTAACCAVSSTPAATTANRAA